MNRRAFNLEKPPQICNRVTRGLCHAVQSLQGARKPGVFQWWFSYHVNRMFGSKDDALVAGLKRRLDEFYNTTRGNPAFEGQNHKPEYWQPIKAVVEEWLNHSGHCRILEFGAGCTSFSDYLGDIRKLVTFEVQDVKATNQEHLSQQADRINIYDILEIQNKYYIIFSTFTYEHITNQNRVLDHLLCLLSCDRSLFIASPRYDFLFCLSPSIRYLSPITCIGVSIW